jgi:hypothetical protein
MSATDSAAIKNAAMPGASSTNRRRVFVLISST